MTVYIPSFIKEVKAPLYIHNHITKLQTQQQTRTAAYKEALNIALTALIKNLTKGARSLTWVTYTSVAYTMPVGTVNLEYSYTPIGLAFGPGSARRLNNSERILTVTTLSSLFSDIHQTALPISMNTLLLEQLPEGSHQEGGNPLISYLLIKVNS